jgi:hypothetical protein
MAKSLYEQFVTPQTRERLRRNFDSKGILEQITLARRQISRLLGQAKYTDDDIRQLFKELQKNSPPHSLYNKIIEHSIEMIAENDMTIADFLAELETAHPKTIRQLEAWEASEAIGNDKPRKLSDLFVQNALNAELAHKILGDKAHADYFITVEVEVEAVPSNPLWRN